MFVTPEKHFFRFLFVMTKNNCGPQADVHSLNFDRGGTIPEIGISIPFCKARAKTSPLVHGDSRND